MQKEAKQKLINDLKKKKTSINNQSLTEKLDKIIFKLENVDPSHYLSTESIMTKTVIKEIIESEENIRKRFNEVHNESFEGELTKLNSYIRTKKYLLGNKLKNEFTGIRTSFEKVSGVLYFKIKAVDFNSFNEVKHLKVFVDRKEQHYINLTECGIIKFSVGLIDSILIEIYLEGEKEGRNIGMVLLPVDMFTKQDRNNRYYLDFNYFNYVDFEINYSSVKDLSRNDIDKGIYIKDLHLFQLKTMNSIIKCNVCHTSLPVFQNSFECSYCNVHAHIDCVDKILFSCKKSATHPVRFNNTNYNIEHQLEESRSYGFWSCYFCGVMIGISSKIWKCKRCNNYFHMGCKEVLFNDCKINYYMKIQMTEARKLTDTIKPSKQYRIQDFTILENLVDEGIDKRILVQCNDDDELYALKMFDKNKLDLTSFLIKTQLKVLEKINSIRSHLLLNMKFYFGDLKNFYIGYEYCKKGTLYNLVKSGYQLNEEQIRNYAIEIITAIRVIHKHKIIHRNINLSHIQIADSGHIKLTSFTLAKQLNVGSLSYTYCGTINNIAPEVFLNGGYNNLVDFWSYGIALYEMFHKVAPFSASNSKKLVRKILHQKPEINKSINSDARDLIERLLDKNPKTRIGNENISEILNHSWFKGVNWDEVLAGNNEINQIDFNSLNLYESEYIKNNKE
ncbi:KAPA [Hepatospora eriocheir]|uniref:protein kinase C n=1 Tax=Hepatospora eriocheir TaxID=1081669 RepID=A0A1X0QL83_9MICR|nr:KAPA [Hepatospora eriocheir]